MNTINIPQMHSERPFWKEDAWRGAFWKVFSCACFAMINGIVRHLSGGANEGSAALSPNSIMFFQNIFGTLFLLPWAMPQSANPFKTQHPLLHLFRVGISVLGVWLWYLTMQKMPIAEGVALSFTGPIFTVIGAIFILNERMTVNGWLAILLSFIGAFIIARPDIPLRGEIHPIGILALLPLGSALSLAFSKLLTRKLASLGASPTSLATYLLLWMTPLSLIPALFEWTLPQGMQWCWLIALGLLAALAHISFSKAYQLAEVWFLTPFGFSKFLLGTIIGYYAFSELPTSASVWVGTGVIFVSILVLGYRISLYSNAKRFKSN